MKNTARPSTDFTTMYSRSARKSSNFATETNTGFQQVNQRIDRLSQRIDQLMLVGLTAAIGIIIASIIVPLLRGG